MSEPANPDYEPTADEIREFLADLASYTPGHGNLTIIPYFEKYLLESDEGIYFSHRREGADGHITYEWYYPNPFPCVP